MDALVFILVGIVCALLIYFGGEKMISILLGIFLIIFGHRIYLNPVFHSFKFDHNFDFTGYNKIFGAALVIFGVLWILTALKKQKKDNKKMEKNAE